MGICASSSTSSQAKAAMGSKFTSMEDDQKAGTNNSNVASSSRSAKYNNTTRKNNQQESASYLSFHTEQINDIHVGRTESELFTCSDDKSVCLLDTSNLEGPAQIVQRWSEHKRPVSRMTYGMKTDCLWTCARDLSMKMWKRGELKSIRTIEDGHDLNITAISLNMDESILCSGSRDTTVCLWDVNTGSRIFKKKTSRNLVTCMSWMNENTIIQGSEDLKLRTWDCRDNTIEPSDTMAGYVYFPLCIDVMRGGQYVCTGSKGFDGVGCEVRLWDMRNTKECVSIMSGHRQSVVGCRFLNSSGGSSSNSNIVSVSKDQTLKIWDCQSKSILTDELGHTGSQFTCIHLSKNVMYSGAASGYSKYIYDSDTFTVNHVHSHSSL
jgi:WD40 repeat protein